MFFFFLVFFHKRGPLWSTVSDFFSLTLLKDWMELRRAPLPAPLPPGGERGGGRGSFPGGGGGGGAAGGGRGGAGGAPAGIRGNSPSQSAEYN